MAPATMGSRRVTFRGLGLLTCQLVRSSTGISFDIHHDWPFTRKPRTCVLGTCLAGRSPNLCGSWKLLLCSSCGSDCLIWVHTIQPPLRNDDLPRSSFWLCGDERASRDRGAMWLNEEKRCASWTRSRLPMSMKLSYYCEIYRKTFE